jgi:acyl phosphate:glycerol-3-phosphate acyltransferase
MHSSILIAAISYLLGSIPFGYLLVRIFRGEDVRSSGSGNIGATNVARTSPALGILTLLLDAGKGLAAVLITSHFCARHFPAGHPPLVLPIAASCAIVGHLFPIWLKFRGGKGVATSLGAFITLTPKSILCMVAIFVILAAVFRYVSLASVCAAMAFPLLAWALHECFDPRQLALIAGVSALVIWKHRHNISRLFRGTESKLGARKSGPSTPATLGATRQ